MGTLKCINVTCTAMIRHSMLWSTQWTTTQLCNINSCANIVNNYFALFEINKNIINRVQIYIFHNSNDENSEAPNSKLNQTHNRDVHSKSSPIQAAKSNKSQDDLKQQVLASWKLAFSNMTSQISELSPLTKLIIILASRKKWKCTNREDKFILDVVHSEVGLEFAFDSFQ